MSTKNKVKYNLSNVHYSVISEGTNGKLTFATPVPIPGAVSLSLNPKGEPEVFYACSARTNCTAVFCLTVMASSWDSVSVVDIEVAPVAQHVA